MGGTRASPRRPARRGRRAHSLSYFIGTGDMINHSVFDAEEVARGLDDLSSRGWLVVDGSKCSLAPEAKKLVLEAVAEAQSPMAWDELAREPRFMAPSALHPDPQVFRKGIDEYFRRMDGILAKR